MTALLSLRGDQRRSNLVFVIRMLHCVRNDYDVDSDGDEDYCLNGEWWDCGAEGSTAQCQAGYECNANHDCVESCGDVGASCTTDAQCCGSIPCDNPTEAGSTTCGCPTGYDWIPALNDCTPRGASCGVPPSNCDVNPLQVGCLYTITPWDPTQGCCEYGEYGGTTDYTWQDVQTY